MLRCSRRDRLPVCYRHCGGAGIGVDELRAVMLEQQPADHELAQLLVHSGRVDGSLLSTGVFRAMTTHALEADGRDYPSARAALEALAPADHIVPFVRVVDQPV